MDVNIKVAVRCRPMSTSEINRNCACIVATSGNSVILKLADRNDEKVFNFDYVYFEGSSQEQVYMDLGKRVVNQTLEGYNSTVFAYGQTGSGKTFTMMGTPQDKGIIPRINQDIFNTISLKSQDPTCNTKFLLTVSYLEIYNEKIKDLLNPSDAVLKVSEHPVFGFIVKDLCELVVHNSNDLVHLLEQGNTVRKVAATNMNEMSSRSHSVFTITLEQKTHSELAGGISREQTVKAKLNLVDLAGSERASKTGATGDTLKEGAKINLSLMTLGTVINSLAAGDKKAHIPYRDSVLTKILKESLGGNAATVMIAAISPADYNRDETLGTLKYATRAKSIENVVVRNEDINDKMIRELKETIEKLKAELMTGGGRADPELELKLQELQAEQQNTWEEKERLSKALAEERQRNMNNVISNMMNGIKEQKIENMKKIKKLTLEKADLVKKQKVQAEKNEVFKVELDTKMKKYNELQALFENSNPKGGESTEELAKLEKRKEDYATKMATLLTEIEKDKSKWTEKKDAMKIIKKKLADLDSKIDEAKAELVVTHNLLESNDKIRQEIMEEERLKARQALDLEIEQAKIQLDQEREHVRGTVQAEVAAEMEGLRNDLAQTKSELVNSRRECKGYLTKIDELQVYADRLESRLADAEALHESSQSEILSLKDELDQMKVRREADDKIAAEKESKQALLDDYKSEANENIQQLKNSYEQRIAEMEKKFADEKYAMFKTLMDAFQAERQTMDSQRKELQDLLAQAAKDILYLNQQNEELQIIIQEERLREPDIVPSRIRK